MLRLKETGQLQAIVIVPNATYKGLLYVFSLTNYKRKSYFK